MQNELGAVSDADEQGSRKKYTAPISSESTAGDVGLVYRAIDKRVTKCTTNDGTTYPTYRLPDRQSISSINLSSRIGRSRTRLPVAW